MLTEQIHCDHARPAETEYRRMYQRPLVIFGPSLFKKEKKKHRVTLKDNVQGKFYSEKLKQAVKEVVNTQKDDTTSIWGPNGQRSR